MFKRLYYVQIYEAVSWLFETLCYKPEGRGFNFSIRLIDLTSLWPWDRLSL
jgi:hypothetical protein